MYYVFAWVEQAVAGMQDQAAGPGYRATRLCSRLAAPAVTRKDAGNAGRVTTAPLLLTH